MVSFALFGATLGLLLTSATAALAQPRPLAVVNGQIIDMRVEQPYRATLLIRGGRIERVIPPNAAIPAQYNTLDAAGTWIIPGLWDMHTHIWDRVMLFPIYLAHGITGVRDMGSSLPRWLAWRDSVSRGLLDGPRATFSGVIVDGIAPFSFFFVHAPTPDSGRAVVRQLKHRGADFIKVYDRLRRDTYLAIAEEAKAQGIHVAGHLPPAVTVADAVRARQRSIEHLGTLALPCAAAGDSLRREAIAALDSVRHFDFARDSTLRSRVTPSLSIFYRHSREDADAACDTASEMPRIARELRAADIWVTPTVVLGGSSVLREQQLEDSLRAILPGWVAGMTRTNAPQDASAARTTGERRVAMLRELRRAGVRVLLGSDAPNPGSVPGIGLHRELELFVMAGYTPYEALRIATRDAAEFMGARDSLGTIEAGRLADLVLLGGDPLTDIRNTRHIRAVVLGGKVLPADTLQARLPQAPR